MSHLTQALRLRIDENLRLKRKLSEVVDLAIALERDVVTVREQLTEMSPYIADLRHWRDAGAEHGHVDGHSWAQETTEIKARVKELECEKADMVLRNKLLRERPDLPAERLAAYVELLEGRDKLRDQLVAMTERARQLEFDNRYLTMSNEVLASNCAAMTEASNGWERVANEAKQCCRERHGELAGLKQPTTEFELFKRKHPIRMWWEQMLLAMGESYARMIGSRHE